MMCDFCIMKSDSVIDGIVFKVSTWRSFDFQSILLRKTNRHLWSWSRFFFLHPVFPSEVIKPHSQLFAAGCCALGSWEEKHVYYLWLCCCPFKLRGANSYCSYLIFKKLPVSFMCNVQPLIFLTWTGVSDSC